MKTIFAKLYLSFFIWSFLISCSTAQDGYQISAVNTINEQRSSETIELILSELKDISPKNYKDIAVVNKDKKEVLSQLIDLDQDSIYDRIIFQADFAKKATQEFRLITKKKTNATNTSKLKTFCRIVPKRIDDFAWENDKVAFRTYGPKCQKLFEEGNSSGLISSGIDCWAKRVDYPIINSWYEAYHKGKSYHEDHGEGLDAYHVGTTRGCGGIAIVENNNYLLSKNFIEWKVIANGPIRSVFELTYAPVNVSDTPVTEKKTITIDLGTQLYHCTVDYTSKKQLDLVAIGLALHKNNGKVTSNIKQGWASYWEPMAGSEIGTGIITNPKSIKNIKAIDTLHKDESFNNLWVNAKIKKNSFSYWSGFGWKKSGAFDTHKDWEQYLAQESKKKQYPIQITIKKK